MTSEVGRARRALIRAECAVEESEAAEAEVIESQQVVVSVCVPRHTRGGGARPRGG